MLTQFEEQEEDGGGLKWTFVFMGLQTQRREGLKTETFVFPSCYILSIFLYHALKPFQFLQDSVRVKFPYLIITTGIGSLGKLRKRNLKLKEKKSPKAKIKQNSFIPFSEFQPNKGIYHNKHSTFERQTICLNYTCLYVLSVSETIVVSLLF